MERENDHVFMGRRLVEPGYQKSANVAMRVAGDKCRTSNNGVYVGCSYPIVSTAECCRLGVGARWRRRRRGAQTDNNGWQSS